MRKKRNNILGASYSQIVPNTGSSSVNWTITFSTTHSSASTVFTQEGGCTTTGLTVSPTSMSFNAIDTSISSYTVSYNGTVLSSNEYNVNSIGGSWIVVSKKGEITVGDNTGNTSRDATVIVALVSDISKTATITVTQAASTAIHTLTVGPNEINFTSSESSVTYVVKYDEVAVTDYTATTDYSTWITGFTNGNVKVSENTGSSRNGSIIINYKSLQTHIAVNQAAPVTHILTVEPTSLNFDSSYSSQTYTVLYDGNPIVDYTMNAAGYTTWIDVTTKKGTVTVTENLTNTKRNGKVNIFYDTLTATLEINQSASTTTSKLTVVPSDMIFSYTGGSQDYVVKFNDTVTTDYSVVATGQMIITSSTKGVITIAENLSSQSLTGIATISHFENISDIEHIEYQATINLTENINETGLTIDGIGNMYPPLGGDSQYKVYFNGVEVTTSDYTVSSDSDWILAGTKGIIYINENDTLVERSANIKFTYIPTGEIKNITIGQYPSELTIDELTNFDASGNSKNYIVRLNGVATNDYTFTVIPSNVFSIEKGGITANQNTTFEIRTGTLTVTSTKITGLTASTSLTQNARINATFTVTPSTMAFPATGFTGSSGDYQYSVLYNGNVTTDYTKTIADNWISIYPTNIVNVTENNGTITRNSKINFSYVHQSNTATTTMSITQSGKTVATWRPSITINMLGEGESTNTMYSAVVVASYSIVDSQGVTGETGSVTLYISDDEGRNTPVFNTVEVPEDSTFEYGHYTPNTLCRCTASKCAFVGANANAATSLTASNKSVVYTLYGTC